MIRWSLRLCAFAPLRESSSYGHSLKVFSVVCFSGVDQFSRKGAKAQRTPSRLAAKAISSIADAS